MLSKGSLILNKATLTLLRPGSRIHAREPSYEIAVHCVAHGSHFLVQASVFGVFLTSLVILEMALLCDQTFSQLLDCPWSDILWELFLRLGGNPVPVCVAYDSQVEVS